MYDQAASEFGPALERLARSYEADPDTRRDLLQEIHMALWRSLAGFRGQCSLRTWVYRVAHNVAATHVLKRKRTDWLRLEDVEEQSTDPAAAYAQQDLIERLHRLIRQLQPLDRELVLLYLEGIEAAEIGEITGISARNVATKIHRIKRVLAARFQGGRHD